MIHEGRGAGAGAGVAQRYAVIAVMAALLAGCASDVVEVGTRGGSNSVPGSQDSVVTGTPGCMRTATGALICTGGASNDAGQWQIVSVGGEHTCGLKVTGSAFCWGSNRLGQLGPVRATTCGASAVPCSLVPVEPYPGHRFVSISSGANHTCAITSSGDVSCWGDDEFGQVGSDGAGGTSTLGFDVSWIQISAGVSHTCAVRGDGEVYCWGANDKGELGNGSTSPVAGAVRVSLPAPAASVSAGQERSCARTTQNVVYCWGAVWVDREGNWEMSRTAPTPELVPSAPAFATLSVGAFTTCGTDGSGSAYCWEGNPRGEIGNGTQVGSTTPLRVSTSLQLRHVSAGMVQACGVTLTDAAYCWGDDSFGELGVDPSTLSEQCDGQRVVCSTVPVAVSGGHSFTQISTGLGSHTCGVTTDGDVLCWGLGTSGQRGDGTVTYIVSTPSRVGP